MDYPVHEESGMTMTDPNASKRINIYEATRSKFLVPYVENPNVEQLVYVDRNGSETVRVVPAHAPTVPAPAANNSRAISVEHDNGTTRIVFVPKEKL
jgi:formate-dependent phosphoribosylglycinamide formyltransferase (GAR transformylase)